MFRTDVTDEYLSRVRLSSRWKFKKISRKGFIIFNIMHDEQKHGIQNSHEVFIFFLNKTQSKLTRALNEK